MPTRRISTPRTATLAALLAALGAATAFWTISGAPATPAAHASTLAASTWKADPVHSTCVFRIKHAGGAANFYGMFRDISATFTLDEADPASLSIEAAIKLASVDTGAEQRDNHLRSPDFFNVRQFPEATFKSTSVEATGETDVWKVKGELSLHGVTKEIEAMVRKVGEGEFRGTKRLGLEAVFQIKRSDFGMTTFLASDSSDNGPLGNTVAVIVSLEGMPG